MKNIIREKSPFMILSVYWDFFSYISQSHKIPDIVGRTATLNEVKQKIKCLIEVECLCGNCIYEDGHGLHFLVPASLDSEDRDTIERIIHNTFNEKLEGMITPYIDFIGSGASLSELLPMAIEETKRNRKTDFKATWMEKWGGTLVKDSLICNVCGKGAYIEDDEEKACSACKSIRKMGRKQGTSQTIFVDEIAWDKEKKSYENVALFVLNFDLNNWMNGKNVEKLFLETAIKEENLSEIGGKIKGIINPRIGPLVATNSIPSKEDIANIEQDIRKTLGSLLIVDDKTRIAQEITCKIDNIPAQQMLDKIDQILRNVLSRYKSLKLESTVRRKNPSPSRLIRVWNNTEEFFKELEKIICDRSYEIERCSLKIENLAHFDTRAYELKMKSDLGETDAEGVFDGSTLHIVTPHANRFIGKNTELEVEITDETWTPPTKTYTCKSNGSYASFKAYRSISISPDMFIFLVSASKTPEILKKIKERYTESFGKVYGRLPLNINIIYFKRKTPFYTVLDSARRFLGHRNTEEGTRSKELAIEVKKEPKIDDFAEIETDIGTIHIPIRLGNGKTDYYYPYLLVEDGQDTIQLGNWKEKHATLLKRGDKLRIHPSFFDFIFLDSNTRRFDISAENGKRSHPIFTSGPRPYYLEDIEKFDRIWKILEEKCDNTQLNNFDSLLISKIEEWDLRDLKELGKSEEFRKLAEASIRNILRIDREDPDFPIVLNSVLSGMFFDVKELYHTILKKKLGGGRNE